MRFFEELFQSGRVSGRPQDVFDAWYAAGVHDYIDYERQAREPMRLSIPADWKLAEVRMHCVNQLCWQAPMSQRCSACCLAMRARVTMSRSG
jgi:hypothetical protein